MRLGAALVGAAVVCALPAGAAAQARLQTEASARQVEVGENFLVQLTALASSADDAPTNPKLTAPPGFTVRGPSVSSQTQVSITNGRMSRSVGITVTWTLSAARPGKYPYRSAERRSAGQAAARRRGRGRGARGGLAAATG